MERHCTRCGLVTTKKAENLFVCANGHEDWLNAVPGATVYIVKDGKTLFGVRSIEPFAGKLCIAGGFVELNETAEQAAVREAKEEFNIDVKLLDFLGTYPSMYMGRLLLNITFVAEYVGGDIIPGDDMSGGDVVWHDIDKLPPISEMSWEWYEVVQKDLVAWWEKNKK